jgi:hypothetical protein
MATMQITTSNDKVSASYRTLTGEMATSTMTFDASIGKWRESISVTAETANVFDRMGNTIKQSASYFKSYFSGYMVANKIISSIR